MRAEPLVGAFSLVKMGMDGVDACGESGKRASCPQDAQGQMTAPVAVVVEKEAEMSELVVLIDVVAAPLVCFGNEDGRLG